MKPVLTVFFDGLKPDSLTHMPFLNSFLYKQRVETILGYSIACHASMYSGVYPNKHLMWFLWQHAPHSSPFRWLRSVPLLAHLDCLPMRLLLHKVTTRFEHRTAYSGIPRIVNLPIRYWPEIDVAEKLFWDETGYLDGYPTVFELLRSCGVPYQSVGMAKTTVETWRLVAEHRFTEVGPWTYLFIGEVDGLSHRYTQESATVAQSLREFDALVERCYREIEARTGGIDFFAFSDHGHVQVKEKINLYELFDQAGDNLNSHMHLIDANYARFWFKSEAERGRVENILSRVPHGFVLSGSDMSKFHVDMPDDRFGQLIFYLDAGSAFSWTTFGYGRKQNSMHGYLPSNPECDGVFVSNRPIAADGHVRLVDILPSLLALLDLEIPPHVEGRVIWG